MKSLEQLKKENKVLILKTVNKYRQAYLGFLWPESGEVKAEKWNPEPVCGDGLHGLLWGKGSYRHLDTDADAKWIVFEAHLDDVVWVGVDKVKVPYGNVIFCGKSSEALAILRGVKWGVDATVNSTTGDCAHSSTVGNCAHSSTVGYAAHSSTTGDCAHSSTVGDQAHSSAVGNCAHSSTTGKNSIACAIGLGSIAKASIGGVLVLSWYDESQDQIKVEVTYPGKNDIKPDVFYTLNDKGKFIEAKNQ